MLCGVVFLADLVFLGSCLVGFWICVLAGVPLAGLGVPWLYTLYSWTAAYLSPLSISYADFLSHLSFSS